MGLAGRPIDFRRIAALSNTPVQFHNSAVTVFKGAHWYGGQFDNTANAAATFIQIFRKLPADVVLGTDAPDYVLVIPANQALNFQFDADAPLLFNQGFSGAATTTRTGNTAPASAIEVIPYFVEV